MTKIDSERFVELVAKSGLVPAAKCDQLFALVRGKYGESLPEDAEKLAVIFCKNKLLTQWHTDKLLAGKYKGFFLGKYKLLGHLGTGGMSSVYLAEHVKMGDRRAIKVLPRRRVNDTTYLARFQNEAKAIASLNHPNIVRAFDIDNEGDVHYIVMEYVDGDDLQQRVRKDGPFSIGTAVDVTRQAALGLQHAHDRNLIHRDVKPANLLIDSTGTVRLLDMGLALFKADDEESLTVANNENVLGTADYLAPEQALNSHRIDHRADVYALGCTLYFMLTGKPPFPEGTLAQRIAKHQTEMPKSIRQLRSDCPGELEGMVVKMIQKDPQYRYQSAQEVADALERWLKHAKQPVGSLARPNSRSGADFNFTGSDSSSIDVDSLLDRPSGISKHDTVSNEAGDTMGGGRSSISKLSAGDSGKLVGVTPRKRMPSESGSSAIDLTRESGYAPLPRDKPRGIQLPPAKDQVSPDQLKTRGGKKTKSLNDFQASPTQEPQAVPWVLVAFFIVMLIVALAIGFAIAKLTS